MGEMTFCTDAVGIIIPSAGALVGALHDREAGLPGPDPDQDHTPDQDWQLRNHLDLPLLFRQT